MRPFLALLPWLIPVLVLAVPVTAVEVPALVPRPSSLTAGPGSYTFTSEAAIAADEASATTARQLQAALTPATGWAWPVVAGDAPAAIHLQEDPALTALGEEGYRLVVDITGVRLNAARQAGLFYAVQTLRQLLPPAIYGSSPATSTAWAVPQVTIEDVPRFPWRGLMLDSGHDFQNLPYVLRFIDLMAQHKYNRFHWHLTDKGTWAIEILGKPELLAESTRAKDVKPGHYTQEQIRAVVRYAAERHITIIPEIDMPGHSCAALRAHPELYCPVPVQNGKPSRPSPWEYCVGNEATYTFLDEVLTQVAGLFPGPYIHIGGDECPKERWERCPTCTGVMAANKLADGQALQSHFIKRIGKIVEAKGKRMIGWDEILEGGVAPNATVMSWRNMEAGVTCAKAGHEVIMAPVQWTYLDYPNVSLYKTYSFDPIPPALTPEEGRHVLGGQGQVWSDNLPSEDTIDALTWPRASVLAETLWSPAAGRDYDALMTRVEVHIKRLAALGVHYRPLDRGRVVGQWQLSKVGDTPTAITFPLPAGASGPVELCLKSERGAPLSVDGIELVREGAVVAREGTPGIANWKGLTRRLELPTGAPLTLRLLGHLPGDPAQKGKATLGIIYLRPVVAP